MLASSKNSVCMSRMRGEGGAKEKESKLWQSLRKCSFYSP